MKKQTNKKLEVVTTTVRDLSSTELKIIVGGKKKDVYTISSGVSVI